MNKLLLGPLLFLKVCTLCDDFDDDEREMELLFPFELKKELEQQIDRQNQIPQDKLHVDIPILTTQV